MVDAARGAPARHLRSLRAPRRPPGEGPLSQLPYYGYRIGEAAVAVLPRRVAWAAGSAIADLLVAASPRRFDGLRDNLRHVLPAADERTIRRLARRNVRGLAHSWINVMAMRSQPDRMLGRLHIAGLENLQAALEGGRGAVVASAHFGAWESGLAMWNARGHAMALLAERLRPPRLFERVAGSRGALGVQVVPLDVAAIRVGDPEAARRAGMTAMREVMRLLRRNTAVAIAIDRDLAGNGELMPFFGADAPIPLGVAEVAIRSGAAIVPVALLPAPDGVDARVFPAVPYDPSAPRQAEIRRVTRVLLQLWEELIRDHPHLWHVLDPIWSRPSRERRSG